MASPAVSVSPSPRAAPVWPLAVALLLVVAAGVFLWNAAIVNDVAWQLWVARQLAHGVALYTDIVEVNPPLWFWAAIPIVNLAQLVGASSYHLLLLCVLVLDIVALLLVRVLCRDLQSGVLIVLGFPIVTLFAFLDVFGQREHLTLIAILPYLVLVARRADGLAGSRVTAIACGILAAFGVALKPHFLLVPVALELLLLVRTRRLPLRPENIALGGSLAVYALSVVLFASAYFATIAPMIALAYQGYDQPILVQLDQPVVAMACLVLLSLPLYGWPRSSIAQVLSVAGTAFLGAYFLQNKGWRYHSVPAMGCFAFAIIAEAEQFRWHVRSLAQRSVLPLAVLAWLCVIFPLAQALRLDHRANALRATSDLRPGDVVGVLSTSGARYWPIPEERHFVWPSRYMTYWMLIHAIEVSHTARPEPAIIKLIRDVRGNAAHDLACHPPRRILEDRYNIAFLKTGLVTFFSADPNFEKLMRSYRRGPDYGEFATYDLVGKVGYRPEACRDVY